MRTTRINPLVTVRDAATRTQIRYAKDYGIVADGTTNDLSALNSLINRVSVDGGGVVLLPVGTVLVNGSVVAKSNVTIRGHGPTSILKLGVNVDGYGVVNIGAVSKVVLENFKIDCQRATLTQANSGIRGLAPGGYTDIFIHNVWVDAPSYAGILMLGDSTRGVITKGVKIFDCLVTDSGGHGIIGQDAVDECRIERNTVIGHSKTYTDTCGITNGRYAYGVRVVGNQVDSTGATGTQPHSISMDAVAGGFFCANNQVSNAVGYGIESAMCQNGTIENNTIFGGAKYGIMLTSDDAGPRISNLGVVVANNVIDGATGGIGIYMGNATSGQACPASQSIARGGVYTATATMRAVEGRRIYECTTSGTAHASVKPAAWGTTATGDTITDGTSVWTDRGSTNAQISILGNTVRNSADVGILLTYAHNVTVVGNQVINCALSGLYVTPSANILTLANNDIQGNNTSLTDGHANTQISAYTGSPHVAKMDNRVQNGGVANIVVIDSTSSSRIDNRIPAGSTTPSVAFGSTFFTQNTGATTITKLIDPNSISGRVVVVRVNDAFTTFQHNSSTSNTMRLRGGVDYAAPSGTVMAFMWDNQLLQWVEISRTTSDGSVAVTTIDVGSTDTTISRVSAGRIAVEGDNVVTATSTDTMTHKTLTAPTIDNIKDSNANTILTLSPVASAVNDVQISNAAASSYPTLTAIGSDTHIGIGMIMKGAGTLVISVPTTRTPTIEAKGADTNHDLNLLSKGTGVVKANGVEVVTLTGTQTETNKTFTSPKITSGHAPASAGATGAAGQVEWDSSYIYVCTATNTWKRAAVAAW